MKKGYSRNDVVKNGYFDLLDLLDKDGRRLDKYEVLATLAVPATQMAGDEEVAGNTILAWAREKGNKMGGLTKEGYSNTLYGMLRSTPKGTVDVMLANCPIVERVDDDGLVVFNQKLDAYRGLRFGPHTAIEYKSMGSGGHAADKTVARWSEPPVKEFHASRDGERYTADLDVTREQWAYIVPLLKDETKKVLECMLREPDYALRYDTMEAKYGRRWESYNSCIIAIGKKAMAIVANRRIIGVDGKEHPIYWPCRYLIVCGDGKATTNALRYELAEAAKAYFDKVGHPKV